MKVYAQKNSQPQQQSSHDLTRSGAKHLAASQRVHPILFLQRTIGNQAVQRLLRADHEALEADSDTSATSRLAHDFGRTPLSSEGSARLQAKLAVSTPGDEYEREADDISEQVMRMPEPQLQRACACGGECPKCQKEQSAQGHEPLQTERVNSSNLGPTAPPIVNDVLASSGQSLDPATRAFMEPRFGQDFSMVRVHTDSKAAESARAVNALAYTVGPQVVFENGHYAPATIRGQKLLAHELAHVVQQGSGTRGMRGNHALAWKPGAHRAAAPANAGAALLQREPKPRTWKGAYVDQAALIEYLMKNQKLSKAEAQKKAPAILEKIKKQGETLVAAYPGLKDMKFDYDLFQDIVIGPDRLPPNCFGDVCKGSKQRWEPNKAEMDAWLKGEGYASTKGCACECGVNKVAVYEITMTYTDGGTTQTLLQPYHIGEQQEDCTWRSRLGNLGVIIHNSAEQLVSPAAADELGKQWASAGKVTFKSAKLDLLCYAKKNSRTDYHGKPGGPLTCSTEKKK